MLISRLAQFASRSGLLLPASLDTVRLGLVGTVRHPESIPLVLSNRAREGCEKLGISSLAARLSEEDVWARVEFRPHSNDALPKLATQGGLPKEASLLIQTRQWRVRLVPVDEGMLVVSVDEAAREAPRTLLLAKFALSRGGKSFKAEHLLRAIAAQELLGRQAERLHGGEEADRGFLVHYQRHLEALRDFLERSTPSAAYRVSSTQPLKLLSEEGWGAAFVRPGTLVQVPDGSGRTRSLSVLGVSADGDELLVESRGDPEELAPEGQLRVRPSVDPIRRMLEALGQVAEGANDAHQRLVRGLRTPGALPGFAALDFTPVRLGPKGEENARQHDAVAMALACPDISLIHGPPGTGKTTVICELILQLLRRGEKVLLVAPTHVALDNVLERIGDAKGVLALRLGSAEATDERLHRFLVSERARSLSAQLVQQLGEAVEGAPASDPVVQVQQAWRDGVRQSPEEVGLLLLLNANLVCATPIGIAMTPEFRRVEALFDTMIMDEASKATVTDFLVPASRARRWVLVGDHKQLAPYLDTDELEGVLAQRHERTLGRVAEPQSLSLLSAAVRRHFEQRMHPDASVRERAWSQLVRAVVGQDAALEPLTRAALYTEDGWRTLSEALGRGGETQVKVTPEARPRAALAARFIAEALQLERVSMPSVFEHLLQLPDSHKVRLNYQQRMHPDLALFSREAVYEGDYPSASHTRALGLPVPGLEAASVWIDTALAPPNVRYEYPRDQRWRGGGYYNPFEVELAVEAVERCIAWASVGWEGRSNQPSAPLEIGVVSFYLEQARRLRDALYKRLGEGDGRWRFAGRVRCANGAPVELHVSVVDRFQGQEKDVIVLSGTRSNPLGATGHVDNLNRLNVALTRARHKRIIIGDTSTLAAERRGGGDSLLARLKAGCEVKHKWGRAWPGGAR